MTIQLGDVAAGSTLHIPFATYNAAGASVTVTGLVIGDIKIYKDGGTTERASTNGYTVAADFDTGLTGIHKISIDLADNSDSGFYAAGSQYWVIIDSVTIDSQTVRFIPAVFRIPAAAHYAALADAILDRDMSAGTDSGTATFRTARNALRFLRNKWSISGTTMTVCKENDTTTAWTSTLTGTAGADPITASDPASS